jgi:ABC-2 type transport system permease protein/sodium transport system permease protein
MSHAPPRAAPYGRHRALLPDFGRLARLARKELSEVLRDRRTVFTLVLMPLLLYPLLSIAFQQFMLGSRAGEMTPAYRLAFRTREEAASVGDYLRRGEEVLIAGGAFRDEPAGGDQPPEAAPPHQGPRPRLDAGVSDDVADGVRSGLFDVGVRVEPPGAFQVRPDGGLAVDLELLYQKDSPHGLEAARHIQRLCAAANARFLSARLRQLTRLRQRPEPVRARPAALAEEGPKRSPVLGALVPLILVLMTITGAVYPAIDLTAGERERGTLEVLVAAPVPRLGLLLAKYVAVLAVATLTALVNLGMMTVTVLVMGLGPKLLGPGALSPLVLAQVLGLMLLFAAFFSAVLLALTSFAHSFKEAQAYLIPLMLVALLPGMLSLLPGVRLQGPLLVAPLLNVVLLARDLFEGAASAAAAAVVVLTTLLYALAALALAARVFGAEAVLYSQQGSWSDLFRRPREARAAATPSAALLCLALMFPATFVANALLAQQRDLPPDVTLALTAAATALVFGAFPLVSAWLGRVRLASALRLAAPGWQACAAAALLGLSLWPFAHELILAERHLGLASLSQEQRERLAELLGRWREVSPAVLVLALGVVPPVLEELFFRGYLFSALYRPARPWAAVLTTAALFGAFHMVVGGALAVERLLSSALLGVVLGWVCWRGGGVVPAVVLHTLHNSLLVLLGYYEPQLAARGWLLSDNDHLPAAWLLAAGAAAVCGALWLWRQAPRPKEDEPHLTKM